MKENIIIFLNILYPRKASKFFIMNSEFTYYLKISTFFNMKKSACSGFNSISDPIYEKSYLESVFFVYLDFVLRRKEKEHYEQFIKDFKKTFSKLKVFFEKKKNKNLFSNIKKNIENLDQAKEELLNVLDRYKKLFFSKKYEFDFNDELISTREESKTHFKIMKILLINELIVLKLNKEKVDIDDDKDQESNDEEMGEDDNTNNLNDLIKSVAKNKFDQDNKILNQCIVHALKINILLYNEDYKKPLKSFIYSLSLSSKRISLLKDKDNNYRILSEDTEISYQQSQMLKKKKQEVKSICKTYNSLSEYTNIITKSLIDYLCSIIQKETLNDIKQKKEKFKKERKELEKNILNEEKILKKNFNLKINSKENFNDIREHLASLKKNFDFASSMHSQEIENFSPQNDYEKKELPISPQKICFSCDCESKENLLEMECFCNVCEECLLKILNQIYEKKDGEIELPCFNSFCKEKNKNKKGFKSEKSKELIETYLGTNKYNEIYALYKKKLSDIKSVGSSKMLFCNVCEEFKNAEEFITFDCDCKICKDCCKSFLEEKVIKDNKGFNINCFNVDCEKPKKILDVYYIMENLFGKEVVEKISMSIANQHAKYLCANPECRFAFYLEDDNKIDFFLCNDCQKETCLKCMKYRHKGEECEKIDSETRKYLAETKSIIRICPNLDCLQPITKDDHCDHVVCPFCKNDICFRCSVLRIPTMVHGNHYHRKDCDHYQPWVYLGKEVLDDEMDKRCNECSRLNKVCDRPNQTIREFYKANKVLEYLNIFNEENIEKIQEKIEKSEIKL